MNDIFKIVLCTAIFWFSGMILCRMFFRAMFQRGIAEGDSRMYSAEDSRRYPSQDSDVVLKSFLMPEHISSNQVVSVKAVTTTTTSTAVTASTTTGETRIRRKHYSAPI